MRKLVLLLAELDLLNLEGLPLVASNSLDASIALADRLFEILTALYHSDYASLLYLTVKAAEYVLYWFLGVFTCN